MLKGVKTKSPNKCRGFSYHETKKRLFKDAYRGVV